MQSIPSLPSRDTLGVYSGGFSDSSGFSPLSLSPALWLNDTGSDPSVWMDISGNGRNASQSDTAKHPAIVTNALNGKQVRRFDGADDFLNVTTGLGMLRNVPGATAIAVYKWITSPAVYKPVFYTANNINSATRMAMAGGLTAQKLTSGGRRLDSDAFQSITSTNDVPASYFVHSVIIDYANSNGFQYVNSVIDGQTTSFQTDGNTSDTDSGAIRIGAGDVGTAASCANIDLAEVLVFSTALSDVNRQKVERYLGSKYGIAV